MIKKEIPKKRLHKMPLDLKRALSSFSTAREAWEDITPLARNEFICWILDAKKSETRTHRIERTCNWRYNRDGSKSR
jgi:uncharacterized protein YdeI (YjbR/CyaY-like superfamily)